MKTNLRKARNARLNKSADHYTDIDPHHPAAKDEVWYLADELKAAIGAEELLDAIIKYLPEQDGKTMLEAITMDYGLID